VSGQSALGSAHLYKPDHAAMSNLLPQHSHTITELDSLAALCATLRLDDAATAAQQASNLLDPIAAVLGAEAAAFRQIDLQQAPRIRALVSIGVPSGVSEAYLADFHRDDPTLHWLQQRSTPTYADHANLQFQRYRRQFLLPNGLVHHVGFWLQDAQQQQAWLFNFHRKGSAPDFDALEHARARLIRACLQGQALTPHHWPQPPAAPLPAPLQQLSQRELQICQALRRGLANKQIAQQLGISPRTVENHLRNIYEKLQLSRRTELLALLLQTDSSAAALPAH
jgi:DNA-binding CsgD family transcriptional regulator